MERQHAGLARIQVAATLKRLREDAEMTREAAANVLGCTVSKIGDLETGRSRVKPTELEALLNAYGSTGAEREQLMATARDSRSRRRRRGPETSIPLADQRLVDIESQARKITFYSGELLPGFLQTDAYATALLEWRGPLDPDTLQSRLTLREVRRANIARPDGPSCWCILGEAALRTRIGGPAVMAAQLRAMLDLASTVRGLVIQVLPLGSGPHGALGITRGLLEFDQPAEPVLHIETNVRNVFYDASDVVADGAHVFDLLKAMAPDWQRSRAIIEQIAREYEETAVDGPP